MGITDYHIFDPNNDYPNKSRENIYKRLAAADKEAQSDMTNVSDDTHKKSKPYNIGYIAGVFDLFHIGHLNMFKRAKEMCNYLIVGVVSDEGVRLNKQAEPFVPFEERIEMVRSCRYVDEAVKLPLDFAGTRDMFKIYHFDVQFSGSDYENNPYWLSEKAFLEENGSTMVFFSYTQSTSSTKLKKAIESRIADNN
ncbi:MAG: adenylyltransferase/cytidyltransferase family protein [Lachnospira sp.]|nr:adenylyltransferase/cytidyltransferase family protein [Lachnospira sp.]